MDEEQDVLTQLIKQQAEKDTEDKVYSVDEKGKHTEYRGKQESTAAVRKRNTDVVFKQTATFKSKGFRQTKGSSLIKNFGVENFPSQYNKKISLDIDPEAIYWWHDEKAKVGGMADINSEKELVKSLEKAKFGAAADDIAKKAGALKEFADVDIDGIAAQKGIDPKLLGGVLGRLPGTVLSPLEEAFEVALGKVGLRKLAKGAIKVELAFIVAGALAAVAGAGEELYSRKFGKDKDLSEEGLGMDVAIAALEDFANVVQYSPGNQLEKVIQEQTGKTQFEWVKAGVSRLGKSGSKGPAYTPSYGGS